MYADADKDKNISIMLIPRNKAIQLYAEICALKATNEHYEEVFKELEELRNHLAEGINLSK